MQEQKLQKNKRKLQFTIMKTNEKGRIIKALAVFITLMMEKPFINVELVENLEKMI